MSRGVVLSHVLMDLIMIHMTWVCIILCSTDSQYHGTMNQYMVHQHTNKDTLRLTEQHCVLLWVVVCTTETLTARIHMEYDLRQYPCVCVAVSISSPCLLLTVTIQLTV